MPELKEDEVIVEMGYLVDEIGDYWIGIQDEFIDKIFEPKFTTKSSGMGLGLGMVKNIVETYKGTIDFTSQPEKGTVFTVRVPKENPVVIT